jgi:hypothetical protein
MVLSMKHLYHPRISRSIPFLFPSASSASSIPWTVLRLPLLPKLLSPNLGYIRAGYAYAFGHEIWDSGAGSSLPRSLPSRSPTKMRASLSSRCCSPSTSLCAPSTRVLSLGCSPRSLATSRWCQRGEVMCSSSMLSRYACLCCLYIIGMLLVMPIHGFSDSSMYSPVSTWPSWESSSCYR